MAAFRPEVREFIRAAETLLSPVSVNNPLTKEECRIVEFYLSTLTDHCNGLGPMKVEANRRRVNQLQDRYWLGFTVVAIALLLGTVGLVWLWW